MAAILGTDISGWQPSNVNLSGLDFVYIKSTQGTVKVNANHDAQAAQARAEGLVVGHYHFPAWGDPRAEAAAFVASNGALPGEFLVLDIENSEYTPWPADPVSWCVAFELEVYRLTGLWCLDYAGPNVRASWAWDRLAALGGALIDPEYNNRGPGGAAPWVNIAMWQNADTNQSGGDSDIFYGDRAALVAYGTPGAVTQSGTITPIQEELVPNQSDRVFDAIDGSKVSLNELLNQLDRQTKASRDIAQAALDAVNGLLSVQLADPTEPAKAYPLATWVVWGATHAKQAPASTLNTPFSLPDGTKTNLAGILSQINAKPAGTVTNTVAALNAADFAALSKAVNDEADSRARARLGA